MTKDFEIFYPTPIAEIEDPTNANIDVCVRTNEGKDYTLVFITPDNLKSLMESNNEAYIHPDFKFIVINQISEDVITAVIKEIAKDSYLLQQYGGDQ